MNLSWGRLCVLMVLIDSWLFIFFTGVLVNGVGLSFSHKTCALAIYSCISFYAVSKVLIYGFLVEKVYIVWSGGNRTPRFRTPTYRICGVVLLGYVAILVLMIMGQISGLRADGVCIIGLKNFATIAIITYDLFLNVFLTAMFLWPLWRSNVISHRLRRVATRTLYGAIASLTTSAANVVILLALRGEEYGWVCLVSCVTDVALNAMVLSWVTSGSYSQHSVVLDRFSLPTLDVGPITLAQSEREGVKESYARGSMTLQTATLHDPTSPIPESYYDYIPREQASQQPEPKGDTNKSWFGGLRSPWRNSLPSSSATPTMKSAGAIDRGVQSLSEEVAHHSSRIERPLQVWVTQDVNVIAEVSEKDTVPVRHKSRHVR